MKYAAALANTRRVPQNRGGVSLPSAQGDTVTGQDNEAGTPPKTSSGKRQIWSK